MSGGARRAAAALAAVWAATLLAYLPSLAAPFQFDDWARLADNPGLQSGDLGVALGWLGAWRVLPGLTLVANYRLGGEEPFGYHLVNLAAHLATIAAVFAVARLAAAAPRLRGSAVARHPLAVATGAALLVGLHPLQTQAVTYVIQRAAVLATLGYVAAVACYLRARFVQLEARGGRAAAWFTAATLCGLAALLSKEHAVTLPVALLLAELVLLGGRPSRRGLAIGAAIAGLLLLVPLALVAGAWRPLAPGQATPSWGARLWQVLFAPPAAMPTLDPLSYLLTQCTVVPRYLLMVVRPWGLSVDHDVAVAHGLTSAVLGGAALLVALFAAGAVAARRAPLLGFGLLWVPLALSVESSLLPISDPMMEHRMYLAMPGVGLAAGSLFAVAFDRRPRSSVAAALGIALALGALTFARNQIWQSPVSLWRDATDKAPGRVRAWVNLGVAHHLEGNLPAALAAYCRAHALAPDDPIARDNLSIAAEQLGTESPCEVQGGEQGT